MNIDYEAIAKKAVEKTHHMGAPVYYIKAIIEAYEAQKARPEWVPLDLSTVKQGQEVRRLRWIGDAVAHFVAVYNGNIIIDQKGAGFNQYTTESNDWLMRTDRN